MKPFVFLVSAALAVFGSSFLALVASAAEEVEVDIPSDELEASAAAREKRLVPKSKYVIELDRPAYFDVLSKHDEMIIEFYANWCMACHGLSSEFDKFAEAAHKKYPKVAITRSDITKVEYLSSSFMVDMLPLLVYIRRPGPNITPEVRYVSANFSTSDLLDYLGGGWIVDNPSGGYTSVWCTPTNLCGHIGGLLGESVIWLDQNLNPFDIPAWAFMAIVVSVIYLLGQVAVGFFSSRVRAGYRENLRKKDSENAPRPIGFNEYRSDVPADKSDAAQAATPTTLSTSTSTKSPKHSGSASKRTKAKKTSKN
ncbi:hypothetical protein IW140_004057 [Coemansia sp. RSA 1813]|nr:hypothetical protein EV178_003062 [Coemansia sp. RSA 1646]KAJ1770381.1 hypothetical protein LPJ74_003260 [Coemansia sp. RSA 1843]KAJ2089406.1 hypothetical protein IW138_003436 [Coemansia sp. RSA 986]KAJ2214956.1 hypothetical protein EV179_002631 [Coemansia sp. RSA 487]KAJ2568239.1 hypothetical protein IW140_004057 [Coemansia sp. RSA 1813]